MQAGYQQLLDQSKQDVNNAALAGARQEGNRLTATYGALTSADSASLMARYGAMLSLSQSGGASPNPFDLKRVA